MFLTFTVIVGIIILVVFDLTYLKKFRDRANSDYDYDKVDDVEIPSQIFDRNNLLIGRSYEENRSLVDIDQIPSVFINALLAQEDHI